MSDFIDPAGHYRRGVILGLSLAELFTILVFLLLLVLGAYALVQEEALEETTSALEDEENLANDQRDLIVAITGAPAGNLIEPAMPGELGAGPAVSEDSAKPSDGLVVGEATEESSEEASQKIERQQQAIDELTRQLAEAQQENPTLPEASTDPTASPEDLQREIERLRVENSGLEEDVEQLEREVTDWKERSASLRRENDVLASQVERGDGPPGQDSPCWFTADRRQNGKPYEKALYIFHVRITDDHVYVRDIAAPTSEYVEQKQTLPFDRAALNRPLRDSEFVAAFHSLKGAGENLQVRMDRRCTFYVAVWDATSETNKQRYKRAHLDTVQAVFNTYEFRSDPWPHG